MFDKRLNQEATNQRKIFVFLVFLSILSGVFAISQAYLISTVVDQTFLAERGLLEAWYLLWILVGVFIGRAITNYLTDLLGIKMGSQVKTNLRAKILSKISSISYLELLGHKSGETNIVLTDAIDIIDDYYSQYLPQVIQAVIMPIMILIVVFRFNIYSALIMLVTAPLIPVFMYLIGSMADSKAQKQYDALMSFSGHFLDILSGLSTLKIFGASKRQKDNILTMTNNFRDQTMDVLKIAFLSALMLEILATISTAMIAVEVGLRLVYAQLSFQTAFFVLLLAPELYLPLKNLGASFHAGKNSIASANLIWNFLGENNESGDEKQVGDLFKNTSVEEEESIQISDDLSTKASKNHLGRQDEINIDFRDISYYYPDKKEKLVLDSISFNLQKGDHIALIGRSGAGKSTILSLLLALIEPISGELKINGKNLSAIDREEWINRLAYLPQKPYIFSGSIYDNIAMAINDNRDLGLEEERQRVFVAAKKAGVDLFVSEFPDAYETMIGEGGQGLSGGERQRLALARVFVRDADLIIFDEPTSGLDSLTESNLIKAMSLLKRDSALITVAHNIEAIKVADKILLLNDGKIEASGCHKDLLEKSEFYRNFFALELEVTPND